MERIILRPKMTVQALFTAVPWMRRKLPEISPKFKMLCSPLGKYLVEKETLEDLSKRAGMEKEVLLKTLQDWADHPPEDAEQISESLIITDLLKEHPEVLEVLLQSGMHCAGCPAASGENLAEAAGAHGLDAEELMKKVEERIQHGK